MNFDDYLSFVKETIRGLARSQGFYGRLAMHLDRENRWAEFAKAAQKADVHDALSLVIWIEA